MDVMQIVYVGLAIIVFSAVLMLGAAFQSQTYTTINATAPSTVLDDVNTNSGTMLTNTSSLGNLVVTVLMLIVVLGAIIGVVFMVGSGKR